MPATHVSQSDFPKQVIQQQGPVLVDFFAEWCGPCKLTSPIIDELASEMPEIKFVKVDVDANQDLASQYSVFSIPTFLIFKEGKVVSQFVGAQSKEGFKSEINKVLSGWSSFFR